jgi:hypothetical protein
MRTVILYGNSLAVSSVGASLRECEGLHVLRLGTGMPDSVSELTRLQPDVVIFDLTATQPNFPVALLRTKPGLVLVGVDLRTAKVLVLSGQTCHVLTTDDLLQVIDSHVDGQEKEET